MTPAAETPLALSIVIPVLNEEDSLDTLLNKIHTGVKEADIGAYEVIFINDGSTDKSWSIIQELANTHAQAHGICFRRTFGKAAALAEGFKEAKGRIIITMDGDLQDDPAEIKHFMAKLDEGYDLVSGWKKERHDPLEKRLPSKLFNAVACGLGGVKLHDMNCGFKAYRREVVQGLRLYGELHRYIPVLANAEGYRVTEIPVQHHAREHGVSKYGWKRYIKGLLDLFTVVAITRFADRPGHLFGGLGLISSTTGFLILTYITFLKLIAGVPIQGRPLFFLGILLLLLGSQLISLGVIGELFIRSQSHDNTDRISERTV